MNYVYVIKYLFVYISFLYDLFDNRIENELIQDFVFEGRTQ